VLDEMHRLILGPEELDDAEGWEGGREGGRGGERGGWVDVEGHMGVILMG